MQETDKKTPMSMKMVFGIFMVIVYFGMGYLFLVGFFDWIPTWINIFLGCLMIVYGIWRGFREFKK